MKGLLVLILMLATASLNAQPNTSTLPKIRFQEGFFSTKWELGEKDVPEYEIGNHLQKHNNEAYYQWRRAKSLETQTVIYLLLASGGILTGALVKSDAGKIAGFSAGGAFAIISLGTAIGSGAKQKRAVNLYNRGAGY